MTTHPFKVATMTPEQKTAMEIARVGFMNACPFYAHYFYSEMREVPTLDIPTAATDGRHIFYNPEYLASLKAPERVFALAHEVDHVICRDPQRIAHYTREGRVGDKPVDAKHWNIAADYVRNAGLMESGVGMMNPSWLYAPDVTGDDLVEEVYARKWVEPPKAQGGRGGGQGQGAGKGKDQGQGQGPGQGPGQGRGQTYAESGRAPKGAKRDPAADAQGGGFDQVLPPPVDPVTGKQDLPDEMEFKEAVARAAAAARAMGNLPAGLAKRIAEILQPQLDWREHIRTVLTGHMGSRNETWAKPNRRRLVLDPMVIMPGRRGYGAELVVVGLDTSGSIYASPKALEAFFAELGGILADVRPKRVMLIECDAAVQAVNEANTLEELHYRRVAGVKGGGGTSFVPVFDYIAEHDLKPDTVVYLTDLLGRFPSAAPAYPVVWASIEDGTAPFGETVRIKP